MEVPREEDDVKSWPPHKYAMEELTKSGELAYGAEIAYSRIEALFGYGRQGAQDWKFRGEWIQLCARVKEAGFLFSEAGCPPDTFRVLKREEMADAVKRRELASANASLRHSLMLANVPRKELKPHEVKKLDHWETKSAVVGATAKVLLRKRNLPSPEMAVKSLRQLAYHDPTKKEGDA